MIKLQIGTRVSRIYPPDLRAGGDLAGRTFVGTVTDVWEDDGVVDTVWVSWDDGDVCPFWSGYPSHESHLLKVVTPSWSKGDRVRFRNRECARAHETGTVRQTWANGSVRVKWDMWLVPETMHSRLLEEVTS